MKDKKLIFHFRVEGRGFSRIEFNSEAVVDEKEYKKLHEGVRKIVSEQLKVPLDSLEKLSEIEYKEMNS